MIYSITSTLPPQHGGRTKSLLKRNKLITEHLNTEATIITTNYNADYPNIIKGFRDKKLINSSIYHENMYDWLSNHMLFHVPTRKFSNQPHYTKTRLKIRGLRRVQTKANHFKYYDAHNRLIRHRVYYKNSRVLKAENRFDSKNGALV
ncbi:alpha-glucosyltransferase N-terminal domain-containing protein [Staphylococcus pettenkoferi]|nr:alpha-glucosyltransferase N-terminal domain-containing protein [Staphylococcus pettenkoferi]